MGGLILSGCKRQEMPKPYAYARLDYQKTPHKTCQLPGFPCRFDYPDFFLINEKPSGKPTTRWVDFSWPAYGVTLSTTYQRTEGRFNAEEQAERMAGLLREKLPMYATLNTTLLILSDSTLKAYLFEVKGSTSIPLEFLITDGKQHLFQGIVQFDQVPNRDALADILDGLNADMRRLITSFTFTPTP